VFIFFIAGVETTAAGLAWALHLIAQHPETQRRLQTEADAVLGGQPATYDDVDNLKLTRRIFDETIRLRPPVWILTRTTATDTELGGHPIPITDETCTAIPNASIPIAGVMSARRRNYEMPSSVSAPAHENASVTSSPPPRQPSLLRLSPPAGT
jgi:cytochrome P450